MTLFLSQLSKKLISKVLLKHKFSIGAMMSLLRLCWVVVLVLMVQTGAGQQLSRAMHGVNMKRSHSFLNHPPSPEVLALWIDGHQVEKVTGMSNILFNRLLKREPLLVTRWWLRREGNSRLKELFGIIEQLNAA